MQNIGIKLSLALAWLGGAGCATGAPTASLTTVIGPFTGHGAPLHPDNVSPRKIEYYGTDLGWTYAHAGELQILFGDTYSAIPEVPIEASSKGIYDDGFGTIDLAQWRDPEGIDAAHIPLIRLGQNAGTTEMSAIHPGFPMEGLKTPLGGFSNGSREFALFVTGKPQACRSDTDCPQALSCDTQVGYLGAPADEPEGLTFPCSDGQPGCNAQTLRDTQGKVPTRSGFCADRSSSLHDDTGFGHVGSVAMRQYIGVRSASDPRIYSDTKPWLTNKFINTTLRKGSIEGKEKVLLWGRPWFIGANSQGRTLSVYFAYVDLPSGAMLDWRPKYFAGTEAGGAPRFSNDEGDAIALDLDAAQAGIQPEERYDIVNQMSVSWVQPLNKWVMFYGGGIVKAPIPGLAPVCGVLQIFARSECQQIAVGNGAIRMRTADSPWGPWSAPQDLIVGGDADQRPTGGQYGPGGVLYHPDCARKGCATASQRPYPVDYGWLYGANVIEEWTRRSGTGVDVLWNASTWNPYRVILLRTHIEP